MFLWNDVGTQYYAHLSLEICLTDILDSFLFHSRGQRNAEEREGDDEASELPGESGDTTKKRKHNKNKKFILDYPHRLDSLTGLGVLWDNHTENKWETMFQKLLIYQQEMGTLRFPTDDQCAATRDEELIALQKWVKSQVLHFRYGKNKNPVNIKRLKDIGFDFEKWYAKPGKPRKSKGVGEDTAGDNEAADNIAIEVDDDRKMPAMEV